MKIKFNFKKALIIGFAIIALAANTAFAATSNSTINNKNSTTQTNLQKESKTFFTSITPRQTLAKLLGESLESVKKYSNKDFSDVYQYAEKKGVLNRYKARRIALAKDNIQKAINNNKLSKEKGSKLLTKIQYNIIHEKAETMGVKSEYKPKCKDQLINQNTAEENKIVAHLKKAIEKNELFLVYQPQVDIKTGKTIGMEALLRWNSKELGNISPVVFIPIAEKNNLMIEIGNWVTNQVCKDLEIMNQNNPKEIKDLRCSVNFSPIQLANNDFVENLLSIIKSYNIKYNQLEIEITESLLLKDLPKTKNSLQQIKELGITIALDDFGIGYSTFSYLLALPIDTIKIDRSFIKDYPEKDDGTLIIFLVNMSKKLNKVVLIEGAETLEQINFLKSLDSDYVQGYYYSKPLLKKDFIRFVQETNR